MGLHEIIPEKFVQHRWFREKNSLLFFSKEEVVMHTFPIMNHSNLRNVVLGGGLSLWIFLNFNILEFKHEFDAFILLLISGALLVFPTKVAFEGTRKFNPDYIPFLTFNATSYLVALQFVTVTF